MARTLLAGALTATSLLVGIAGASAQVPPVSPPPQAAATLDDDVRYALNAFVYGDYREVVARLRGRILPLPPPGTADALLVSAYSVLGVSAVFVREDALADEAFLKLLLVEPAYELDPLLYPASVIARFEEVRRRNAALLPAQGDETGGRPIYIEARVVESSRLSRAMPFGIGFLARGDSTTGFAYMTGQTLLGATSVALFVANEAARRPDGYFDDVGAARARRSAQMWTAGAFFAVLAANVAHGLLAHDGPPKIEYRTLPGPPEPSVPAADIGFSWTFALP
jgi:hypothetical protein